MFIKPAIIAVILAISGSSIQLAVAESELYNCDGVFRNIPCGEKSASGPSEEERRKRVYLSEKRSLLHGLTMKQLRARDEFGVDIDIGSARDVCNRVESPLDDCRAEAERLEGIIVERTAAMKVANEKERANALQEEANRIQQERNQIEANKPNVTVIQQYPIRRRPYPPGTYLPGTYPLTGYPGTGPRPFPPPPVVEGGGGVNVEVNVR